MVRIHEEFLTKDAAKKYWHDYLQRFPASKWGTYLRFFRDRLSGLWTVAGQRFTYEN